MVVFVSGEKGYVEVDPEYSLVSFGGTGVVLIEVPATSVL